jgi:hypothetical protein
MGRGVDAGAVQVSEPRPDVWALGVPIKNELSKIKYKKCSICLCAMSKQIISLFHLFETNVPLPLTLCPVEDKYEPGNSINKKSNKK